MTKYGDFEYNDSGVCLNPVVPYKSGSWNLPHFEIRIAETPRGWVYGYMWGTPSSGGGCACFLNDKDVFPTRPSAIVAAAKSLKESFGREAKTDKIISQLDRIIKDESNSRKIKQYTIFDYLK